MRHYNPSLYRPEDIPQKPDFKVIDCPQCRYRIPVPEEFVDYKAMHESLDMYQRAVRKRIDAFVDDMIRDCPEVEIYLHNKKCELIDLMEQMQKRYNG